MVGYDVICTPVLVTLQVKHQRRQRGATRPQSAGQGQPRRRYQRVVRNENAPPPDQPDDNPFVVRKFTQVRSREEFYGYVLRLRRCGTLGQTLLMPQM